MDFPNCYIGYIFVYVLKSPDQNNKAKDRQRLSSIFMLLVLLKEVRPGRVVSYHLRQESNLSEEIPLGFQNTWARRGEKELLPGSGEATGQMPAGEARIHGATSQGSCPEEEDGGEERKR